MESAGSARAAQSTARLMHVRGRKGQDQVVEKRLGMIRQVHVLKPTPLCPSAKTKVPPNTLPDVTTCYHQRYTGYVPCDVWLYPVSFCCLDIQLKRATNAWHSQSMNHRNRNEETNGYIYCILVRTHVCTYVCTYVYTYAYHAFINIRKTGTLMHRSAAIAEGLLPLLVEHAGSSFEDKCLRMLRTSGPSYPKPKNGGKCKGAP